MSAMSRIPLLDDAGGEQPDPRIGLGGGELS
jgi:hypothetical protein